MTIETAERIYAGIRNTKLLGLRDDLIDKVIRYARIRTDFALAGLEKKIAMEDTRSRAHDALIDSCNILSRNMHNSGEDNHWREILGSDRKNIGDFACYLHCILGIMAR